MSEQIPFSKVSSHWVVFSSTFVSVDKDAAASSFILNLVLMPKTWSLVQKRILETEF